MNSQIYQWAARWNVPYQAIQELGEQFGIAPSDAFGVIDEKRTEAYTQSLVRLEAGRKGLKLWRNNVGVLMNQNGTPIRYGLANDSPALNKAIKSGDLIGWRPVFISPGMVGMKIAQFLSRECKRPGWSFTATEHENAQLRWINAINADGGDAGFVTGEGSL